MAIKGSIFNNYSPELKVKVVEAYLSGKYGSQDNIAKHFGVRSRSQVNKWVKIYKESGLDALYIDNRGKASKEDGVRKGRPSNKNLDDMTKDEQIAYLKMENDILKKVQALQKH